MSKKIQKPSVSAGVKIFFLFFLAMILCGCSFVPRSAIAFPDELKPLYFSTVKPYSTLSNQLNALFRSMDVTLVKQKSAAPFSIVVSYDHFSYARPDIVDATLPSSINYSQSSTVSIVNNKNGATVASQSFTTTQSITINANQIYTMNANDLVRQELNRQMTSLIYYWLISYNTKVALHHAIITQTIKHAS